TTCGDAKSSFCRLVYPTVPSVNTAPAESGPLREPTTIPARTVPPIEVEAVGTAVGDKVSRSSSKAARCRHHRHNGVAARVDDHDLVLDQHKAVTAKLGIDRED